MQSLLQLLPYFHFPFQQVLFDVTSPHQIVSLDRACVCTPDSSQGMADTVLPEKLHHRESNSLKSKYRDHVISSNSYWKKVFLISTEIYPNKRKIMFNTCPHLHPMEGRLGKCLSAPVLESDVGRVPTHFLPSFRNLSELLDFPGSP